MDGFLETIVGTPNYEAPEILKGQRYGHNCDLFSIGIILFQMVAGELPFKARSEI